MQHLWCYWIEMEWMDGALQLGMTPGLGHGVVDALLSVIVYRIVSFEQRRGYGS
jgi:hypothetical protein